MRPETHAIDGACQILEWDSEFFGRRIARVEASHLAAVGMRAVEEWCENRRVDCAYLLADVGDRATCEVAQAHGFLLVDVRLTLQADTPALSRPAARTVQPAVRLVRADDLESLKAIARASHRDTRFYVDGHFDRRRCEEMYELWIAKSCNGWADRVFVADVDGAAVGYVTCHLTAGTGKIGLVAVGESGRGRGAGSALVAAAQQWFVNAGAERVLVVTQARNAAAVRLYQRAGMSLHSVELWFHRWW